MAFEVFIEGARDSSSDGVRKLAGAIASRYGLPLETLLKRLGSGRFRVKKGVDQATARAFAADLVQLGARCSVIDAATGQPVPERATTATGARAPAIPAGAVRSAPPAARPGAGLGAGTPPPEPVGPAAGSVGAADSAGTASTDDYQSGLAAAFSGGASSQDLGALSQFGPELTPTDSFRLSSIDGEEEPAPAVAEVAAESSDEPSAPADPDFDPFAPPDAQAESSALELAMGTAEPSLPPASATGGHAAVSEPVNEPGNAAFAPPDEGDVGFGLDDNVLAPAPARPRQTPAGPFAATRATGASTALLDDSSADAAPTGPPRPSPRELLREHLAESPQVRALVGVVLVALLAFVPARMYWGHKVARAQADLNLAMIQEYQASRTDSRAWEGLPQYSREQLAFQRTRLSSARVTSILLMLTLGGALGFLWFKKIPWDQV